MDHPTPIRPESFASFRPDKMGKATLFESGRLLVGLNCFEPGQEREGEDRDFFYQFSPDGYALGMDVLVYAMTH